jgi:HSP20 family protein
MTMLTEPHAPWLRDLNRLFTGEGAVASFIPPADVLVGEDGVTVYMDVPGLSAESLEIELDNDVLTVRGERPFRRIERRFGRFERSLRVPRGLDPGSVQAELADGVLTLRIPKPPELEPRRVEIKTASSSSQSREPQESAP